MALNFFPIVLREVQVYGVEATIGVFAVLTVPVAFFVGVGGHGIT
jgi:hypothetical protein